ncbi:phage tail protein I [Bradyrhizobium sp. BWC-3-1]|uniref:phage tail protein I n=1 Tax=Bradyrhizobium sp. BWC-3-1 TaxID=3080012 RepID=UPI00293E6333|nr:phage tail protein I [Bradyrhizobium sp. BWC-3-1]WOH61903.1 phage tail protein I [Bradyrhizobium sp. BWC-3-1]
MSDTLLPSNATVQERAMEGATSRISDVPVLVRESKDPGACPAVLLPWLAHQFSVDAWQSGWTDEQKRQTIRDSVFVHQRKGTIGAVKRALGSLGFGAQVQEWFNQSPPGPEYTFLLHLDVDQVGISDGDLANVLSVVDSTKNLRSHLETVIPTITTKSQLITAGVSMTGSEITVTYEPHAGSPLLLDGDWQLDGSQNLDGVFN